MKIKVCGMKYPSNIRDLSILSPDYMGFIFYKKSKRYVEQSLDEMLLQSFTHIRKVGVFVNDDVDFILLQANKYGLSYIQLHGDESPDICNQLQASGIKVIKAFSVDDSFDFADTKIYKTSVDYFLFDTKGENYGGTGKKFNWEVLSKYDNDTPFFLSGGIDLVHADDIRNLTMFNIHAVDINSKFEKEPGLKNVEKISEFIERIKTHSI